MYLNPNHKSNPDFDPMLCQKVVEFRALNNLTQAELAKLLGVSTATVVNVETGRRGPSKTLRVKLLNLIKKGR